MGKAENIVEGYFISRCKELGIFQAKIQSPGKRGMPDRVAIGNGNTIFIEMKAENGRPSEQQLLRIREINAHGGIAVFAYSKKDIEDILNTFFIRKGDMNDTQETEKAAN